MTEQIQRLTTKAIITRDNKTLLVCEPDGRWGLPGGKPDFGEHMIETIKREIQEELSIDEVNIISLAGQFDFVSKFPEFQKEYQFVVLVFRVDVPNSEIKLSDEHNKYGWFSKEEIMGLNLKDEYKAFLKDAL